MKEQKGKPKLDSILFIKANQDPEKFVKKYLRLDNKKYAFGRLNKDMRNKVLNKCCVSPKNFFKKRKGTAILVKMNKGKGKEVEETPKEIPVRRRNKRRVMSPEPIRVSQDLDLERNFKIEKETKKNRKIYKFYKRLK